MQVRAVHLLRVRGGRPNKVVHLQLLEGCAHAALCSGPSAALALAAPQVLQGHRKEFCVNGPQRTLQDGSHAKSMATEA